MKLLVGNKSSRSKAQSTVEFALILPILLVIILGIIELGRYLFIYIAVTNSSREGARYGSSTGFIGSGLPRYLDCAGIRESTKKTGILIGINDDDIDIIYDAGSSPQIANCDTSSVTELSKVKLGDRVVVTVEGEYSPIVPIPFVPLPESYTIVSTTARTIVKDISVGTAMSPPTRTPTPFLTFTPTITPTPTETPLPTDTPTITSTPTETGTPTVTSTVTLTPTAPTPTPTTTSTSTSTPTSTVTRTPIPVCHIYSTEAKLSGDKFTWRLWNTGTVDTSISQLYLEFSDKKVVNVQLGGSTLWSLTNGESSPSTIDESEFASSANPALNRNTNKEMIITFNSSPNRIILARVTFDHPDCPSHSVSNISQE